MSDISQLGLVRTNYCTGCKARQDTIEAQAAEIKRLREAGQKLSNHACHDDDCQHGVWSDPTPCTCGYEDAWKAWSAALGETE